jgi:carboxyl-terminal processing protease
MLYRRGVFYSQQQGVGDFTRYYLGEKPDITKDFVVNDAVVTDFRKYLDKQKIKYTDADIQANIVWLKWQIKREVFTSYFGLNDGYKVELQDDVQLEKAIDLIPQAKALYQNARKILAERNAGQLSQPQ